MITQNGEEGNVTILRMLDRENEALHVIHILAIDKGMYFIWNKNKEIKWLN